MVLSFSSYDIGRPGQPVLPDTLTFTHTTRLKISFTELPYSQLTKSITESIRAAGVRGNGGFEVRADQWRLPHLSSVSGCAAP